MVMAALFNSISCCLDSAVIDETAAGSPQHTTGGTTQATARLKIVRHSTEHRARVHMGTGRGPCHRHFPRKRRLWLGCESCGQRGAGAQGDSDLGVRPGTVAPPPVSSSLPLVYLE